MARTDYYKPINYSAQRGAKLHKFKSGENVFRVMPQLTHSGLSGNNWAVFHRVHWGYGITGKDASGKSVIFPKPFFCQFKGDKNNVEVACEHCARGEENARALKAAEVEVANRGMNKEQAEKFLAPLKALSRRYNVEKKMYFNDLDADGTLGFRKISYAHYKILDKKMKELFKDGIDATHPDQGVWWKMTQTGTPGSFMSIRYSDPELVMIQNGRSFDIKPAPLSDEELERATTECANLFTGLGIATLSDTQIRLLAESNGTPEEVESILGITQTNEAETAAYVETEPVEATPPAYTPAPVAAAPAPALDKKAALLKQLADLEAAEAAAAAPAPAVDPEEAELAALQAKIAAKKAAQAVTAPAPRPAAPVAPPLAPPTRDATVDDLMGEFAKMMEAK